MSRLNITHPANKNSWTYRRINGIMKERINADKMPLKFQPNFTITPKIASALMRIEGVKQTIKSLPITPAVVTKLRETARLVSTHYSTMIEGNRLTQEQVERVLKTDEHFPSRERDEHEVKGYYSALAELEHLVAKRSPISESVIQKLHALVMGKGKTWVKPSHYRDGQNVIRDAGTGKIVYMPPEAKDVPRLMKGLVDWIKRSQKLPNPIVVGISHYQFATIHPYYDGNGRTARLLTTLVLHLGGYDLKGLYSLEKYYAHDLKGYYEAISIGPSHNYYMGRAEADITSRIGYFCEGMAHSFEKVRDQAKTAAAQETGFGMETEAGAAETTISEEREEGEEPTTRTEIEEESYFSDRARWRRGGIVDPDANEW